MSDFVEWNPKHHGHKPPYWKPDMLASVDGKNFVLQTNWAWIAGSTYYVPPEAVGLVREDVDRKLACAREANIQWLKNGYEAEEWIGLRAIELWEEGFGK